MKAAHSAAVVARGAARAYEMRDYLAFDRAVEDNGVYAHLGHSPAARMKYLGAAHIRRKEILEPLFARSGSGPRGNTTFSTRAQHAHDALFSSTGRPHSFRGEQVLALIAAKLPEAARLWGHRATTGGLRSGQLLPPTAAPQPPSSPGLARVAGEGGRHWARSSLFGHNECSQLFLTNVHNASLIFVDRTLGLCHLCREPLHNLATHAGYWDHATRVVALRMCIAYNRGSLTAVRCPAASRSLTAPRRSTLESGDSADDQRAAAASMPLVGWCPESVITGVVVHLKLPVRRAATWAPSFWYMSRWAQWSLYTHAMTAAMAGYQRPPLSCDVHMIGDVGGQADIGCSMGTRNAPRLIPFATLPPSRPPPRSREGDAIHEGGVAMVTTNTAAAAAAAVPSSMMTSTTPSPIPALNNADTMARLHELRALIMSLVRWGVLSHCFTDPGRPGLSNEGERCFRATVSALLTPMMFPLSAQGQTRWSQKFWGRQTLEMLFDALDLGRGVQSRLFSMPVAAVACTKDQKAAVMRQLIYQVHCVTDACGADDDDGGDDRTGSSAVLSMSSSPSVSGQLPRPPEHVLVSLCEMVLHRIAFELIHIRTSILMDEASGGMWCDLGFPTSDGDPWLSNALR